MQEYVNKIMLSYGASEAAVRGATGCLIRLVKERASEDEFKALHQRIRGLTRLLKDAAEPGDGGEVATAKAVLDADGLNEMRVKNTLRMFGTYFAERAGPELTALVSDVPELFPE